MKLLPAFLNVLNVFIWDDRYGLFFYIALSELISIFAANKNLTFSKYPPIIFSGKQN